MIQTTLPTRALLAAFALVTPSLAQSSDWNQFRGPGGRAVADDTPISTRFGPDQDVLWKTSIPAGQSSPCILGERIFLSGFEDDKNVALALDRTSGELLWKKSFEWTKPPFVVHPDSAVCSPTPVADGERVIFYFGDYGLVALDHAGEIQWEKRLPSPGYAFGVGASPLLYDGMLIVCRDGAAEAAILVLDAADGSEAGRIDRFDFSESHGTPFLWQNAGRDELVVGGTDKLCSFDLATLELLWSVPGTTNFPCTTPTADADTLYYAAWSTPNATGRSFWEGGFARSLDLTDEEVANPTLLFERLDLNADGKVVPEELPESRMKDAFMFMDRNQSGAWEPEEFGEPPSDTPGKNIMVAVSRGAEGDASESHVRWSWTRGLPYVSSPLLYADRLWLFKSGGLTTVLDAKTGKAVINRSRLEDRSEYYMSPVGAAGHVLIGSAEGTLYMLDAKADELTIEHSVTFDEGLFATPAILNGVVYLRTRTNMWAFGSK